MTPIDRQAIVFFDGVCGLCNQTVDFLMSRDQHYRLKFAPLQGRVAGGLLTAEERNLDSIVFCLDGKTFQRSAAIVRILWTLGGVWSAVGTLIWLVPKPLRDFGYSIVARVRYRVFGKRETCRMPTEADRERMLE